MKAEKTFLELVDAYLSALARYEAPREMKTLEDVNAARRDGARVRTTRAALQARVNRLKRLQKDAQRKEKSRAE